MNIGIVEDEKMAATRLIKLLKKINENIKIVCNFASVEETVVYFQQHEFPDLLLLDIQLNDGLSFELFDLLTITCPVVFTTAFDEYALKAFRVHAVDYLLKPIKEIELANVLSRLNKGELSNYDNIDELQQQSQTKKVLVKMGQSLKVLTLDLAAFYYSEHKITFYMGVDGKRYPVDLSLDKLETILDESRFFRINRQFIVSQDQIRSMVSYSVNRIKLEMNPKSSMDLVVSKDKVSRFRKWLVS